MSFALAIPWAPAARCYCAPQRLIFTLALGEDPDRIPPRSQVRALGIEPADASGHGALDRVLWLLAAISHCRASTIRQILLPASTWSNMPAA